MLSRNACVGLFLICGIVLFGVGLFLIGDQRQIFSRGFEAYTEFVSVKGLQNGANIRVSGLDAGEVVSIQPPSDPSQRFRLKLRLNKKVSSMIRQDSLALIQTEGLVGNQFLEIDKGSEEAPECTSGCTIPSKEPFDFADLMVEARGLFKSTGTTLDSAGQVADNLNQALKTFLASDATGKNGPKYLTDTVVNAQRAMSNLADDTEALKHNFLFRGFFNQRGFFDLSEVSADEYRSSKFVKDKSAKRVWIEASKLFAQRPNGPEELTKNGRSEITRAMTAFLGSLPNSPIMVEGYYDKGPPDERYQRSLQRAEMVQGFVQKQFQLKPKYVGAIPLIDSPPPKVGKEGWDGVALVLLP